MSESVDPYSKQETPWRKVNKKTLLALIKEAEKLEKEVAKGASDGPDRFFEIACMNREALTKDYDPNPDIVGLLVPESSKTGGQYRFVLCEVLFPVIGKPLNENGHGWQHVLASSFDSLEELERG
jgi:hypothetical protein